MAIKINIAFKVKITYNGLQEGGYFRFIDFGISSANLEKTASQLAVDWNHRDEPYFYKDLFSDFQKKFPELGDEQKNVKLASIDSNGDFILMENWQDLHVLLYLNKGKSIGGVMEIPLCITQWPPRYFSTDMKTNAPTTIVMAKSLEKLEQKDAEILHLSNRVEALEQQLLPCECKLEKKLTSSELEIDDDSIILASTERKEIKIKEQHQQLNAEMKTCQKIFTQQLAPWRI